MHLLRGVSGRTTFSSENALDGALQRAVSPPFTAIDMRFIFFYGTTLSRLALVLQHPVGQHYSGQGKSGLRLCLSLYR